MITKRLRAFCAQVFCANETRAMELRAIANDIDREYESACAEAYGNGVASVELPDMANYVKLPLDADGEPIRVGDVMEFSEFEIEHPVTRTVEGIGQGTFFAWCGERGYQQHEPKRYRHHRPPTVEDVLREFALRAIRESEGNYGDLDETCAEYATKLRLASDDE